MTAHSSIRAGNALDRIAGLDDRDLLMLIDRALDHLSEDLADSIAPGLAQAFDAIEEGRSYQHVYPAGLPLRDWSAWNAHRDQRLAKLMGDA
ncbi:hypothetical protein SAMN05660666_02526 [Novosphingobium aromaticivorans]|nr:hypothetical protein [Novosphingobium aromaticivorans]SCY69649.1 hypothetical protein SAMN05660666_02526 [Novosphingobium aromaticivorans]